MNKRQIHYEKSTGETEKMATKKKQNTDSDTSQHTDKVQRILISDNVTKCITLHDRGGSTVLWSDTHIFLNRAVFEHNIYMRMALSQAVFLLKGQFIPKSSILPCSFYVVFSLM